MTQIAEFPLPDPRYEKFTWTLQDEHNPASHTPLIASAPPVAGAVSNPDGLPTTLNVNGYNYARDVGNPTGAAFPFGTITKLEQVEDLTKWREEWLPEVEKVAIMLEDFEGATVQAGKWGEVLDGQDQEYRRVFGGIHRSAVGPSRVAVARFTEEYVKRFGESRSTDVMALLLGFPNRSLARAGALWDLSRILRADDSLKRIVDTGAQLPDTAAAKAFQEGFDAMLKDFGCTANNGLQDLATWRDGSPIPLAMIRAYAAQDDSKSPREATIQHTRRRFELEAEVRGSSSSDKDTSDLVLLMEMAQQLIPNLEDHNLWCDQRLFAASRVRWLAVGAHLRDKGVLSVAEDVFYHRRPELVQVLEGWPSLSTEEVEHRRTMQERFRATLPPLFLGLSPETPVSTDEIPVEGATQRLVKGIAASPGSHSGRARVIQSLDEASSLQDGEVLVVRSLTPAWTPYYGIIGAVVTNSGGPMSHGAVVAREFGIPAVVGTVNGTNFILDGVTVTVDGTTGVVVIESQ
jgi:pyruvate,water dikinase